MAEDTAPAVPVYDAENIFAKILDRKVPCFKVFENRTTLAILDAYPVVEGHTLVMPKLKGYPDLLSMPPAKAALFLQDVQRVARAVKEATGADAVNILNNSGEASGQEVPHPHFHIVPRKKDDNLALKYPPSAKEMLTAEKAAPVKAKVEEALFPKKPLRKAKFGKVSDVRPDSVGMNLKLKVVADVKEVEGKIGKFYEVLCGDPSGTVVVSFRDHQKEFAKKDNIVALRNAATKMVNGHVRLAVDKWGKVEECDEPMDEEVEMSQGKNVSATEYELVVSK
mmetsp:Transcript_59023/g.116089  ORF Transcript_59023/g.116089 Transcript_59023/m.116089 type:complete len:281 (-) Transcript_59023:134-976(-)